MKQSKKQVIRNLIINGSYSPLVLLDKRLGFDFNPSDVFQVIIDLQLNNSTREF